MEEKSIKHQCLEEIKGLNDKVEETNKKVDNIENKLGQHDNQFREFANDINGVRFQNKYALDELKELTASQEKLADSQERFTEKIDKNSNDVTELSLNIKDLTMQVSFFKQIITSKLFKVAISAILLLATGNLTVPLLKEVSNLF